MQQLTLGLNGVYSITIGQRTTPEGKVRPQKFALSTNRWVSLGRAWEIHNLWLRQADGIWGWETVHEAKRLAKGG
jgi:hypothetical protein